MTFPLLDYDGPEPRPECAENYARFMHIRDGEYCEEHRAGLRALWEAYEPLGLADPDFAKRFHEEFESRVWEMRLATTFVSWGWPLVAPKRRGEGPDIGIGPSLDAPVMWVEAIAPGNSQVEAIESFRVAFGAQVTDTDRKVMLRYLSAIHTKRDKYRHWLSKGIVKPEDGFVIAVSGALVPEGWFEIDSTPRIVRALFGLGKLRWRIPLDGGEPRPASRTPMMQVARTNAKGERADVKATLFLEDEAPEVSAVLWSGQDFKNRPDAHGYEAGHDFVLIHNPFAERPLEPGQLKSGREFFMRLGKYEHRAGVEYDDD